MIGLKSKHMRSFISLLLSDRYLRHTKNVSIFVQTFTKNIWIRYVIESTKIAHWLPEKFGFVFDG